MEIRFTFKLDVVVVEALPKAFAATVTTLAVWNYAPGAAQLVTKLLEVLP